MKDPRAVEIIHEQSADKDEFVVKGYWEHDDRGHFDTAKEAAASANARGFVVCTRPQPRDPSKVRH